MHLQKTSGTAAGKAAPEKPVSNVSAKAQTQAAKTSALPSAPRSVSSIAAAAGLPSDKLSVSIVSFARFFSLPLKPQMLAAIRRQAFTPPSPSQPAVETKPAASQIDSVKHAAGENTPDAGAAAKNRQALSLAAAAAESKGVELSPKGLEAYAEAVDPDWQERQGGGQKRRQHNKNQDENAEEKAPLKTAPVTASAIEKMAKESDEKNIPLSILNKLPGKNGRRWIVLPLDFSEGGSEFRVSMRILLENGPERAVCMALDIAESGETERRWLFMLESANDRPVRLTACIQPEFPQKDQSRLRRELSGLLKIPIERVFVKTCGESFPFEAESVDQLHSVDEAV